MTLISTDSIQYKRRLVRKLNFEGGLNGFYASIATMNVRCNRARLRGEVLEVHSPFCSPEWFAPSCEFFTDAYGREVLASIVA